jgi:CRISPR-associated exonuclease Cas4
MDSSDPIPISALQHYLYCPRQCALIHIEQTFDENIYTLRGQRVHKKVDEGENETQEGVKVERSLPLFSERLGLTGKADVVEFHDGKPYPVEYKSGKRKNKEADDLQLCAQAMCLEDMFGTEIQGGSLYYDRSRHRRIVKFDKELRALVIQTVADIRDLFEASKLPEPVADKRCDNCSLIESCMPFSLRDYKPTNLFEVT